MASEQEPCPSDAGEFSPVFQAELAAIRARREKLQHASERLEDASKVIEPSSRLPLVGLALSGGGIRSASFSLGVLQVLAKEKVLSSFDYLSTVSGGGYIGTSLNWFLRHGEFGPDGDKFPYGTSDPGDPGPAVPNEGPAPLDYLRSHGKFLSPGGGIGPAAGFMVLLRGIVLNVVVWLPLVALPFYFMNVWLGERAQTVVFVLALLLLGLLAVAFVVYSLLARSNIMAPGRRYECRRGFEQYSPILLLVALACFALAGTQTLAAYVANVGLPSAVAGIALGYAAIRSSTGPLLRALPQPVIASLASLFLLFGFVSIAASVAIRVPEVFSSCHALVVLGATFVAVFVGWFANINYVSLHRFYRDRLMEAFLPNLKRPRRPREVGPATEADGEGLDPDAREASESGPMGAAPYHLINTNVVQVGAKCPRLRLRGGDSFVLAPKYSGSAATGWFETSDLEPRMRLATAMAISGAAVNPHTASGDITIMRGWLFAVLMSLLNLRLGYWITNPGRAESTGGKDGTKGRAASAKGPVNLLTAAWYTLLGRYHETSRYLELTDGGHFENLGLYELIRRRVSTIVVCDGGQDGTYDFTDLQVAFRLIAADFGVRLEFDRVNRLETMIPDDADGFRYPTRDSRVARRGFIVGKIIYGNGQPDGRLLYLKPTMISTLGLRTKGYKGANPDFPNQTTADQFFDEDQFEAYRELGYRIAESTFDLPHAKDFWEAVRAAT